MICPLHGPVLDNNLEYYLGLYDTWSGYKAESEGVLICYTSVYGNTKKAVLELEELLKNNGCKKVVVNDLARCDIAEAVEDAFRYGKLVLATTTYNGDVTGTALVIGLIFTNGKGSKTDVYEITIEVVSRFEKEHDSIICKELLK